MKRSQDLHPFKDSSDVKKVKISISKKVEKKSISKTNKFQEENTVNDTLKDNSSDLVIPLILKNIYKSDLKVPADDNSNGVNTKVAANIGYGLNVISKPTAAPASTNTAPNDDDDDVVMEKEPELTVEEQAIQSLINGQLPILAQNTIPGIESLGSDKEKFMHDISLRPDEMSVEDYQRVPIESFGVALLKGMGWKEGTAVGKNPNGLVAPIVLTPRASLLGLGATPAPELLSDSSKDKRPKKVLPGDKIPQASNLAKPAAAPEYVPRSTSQAAVETNSTLKVGSRVVITEGSRKGSKGIVTELYSKSGGKVVKVKLDESGEVKGVWDDQVKLDQTLSVPARPTSSWLRRFIRVRIVSKSFRGGEFYNQKCIVQDVTTIGQCIVKTSKGVVLDQVLERYLETVIPSSGKSVMILKHKQDSSLVGQVATLMECNDAKQVCTVRVDSTFDMETLPFDDISEYVEDY